MFGSTQTAALACALGIAASTLGACTTTAPTRIVNSGDAVVDVTHAGANGELRDGMPTFQTIQAALNAAPSVPDKPFRIFIKPGRYYEKLVIRKPYISLIGASRDGTVLSYDAVAGATSPDGNIWGTSGSGTLIIKAPDFRAENLTIENTFDYNANRRKRDEDPGKLRNPQGVAVMTDNGADRSQFHNVRILGNQDTLYVEAGRSYFSKSLIAGHVDFILGAGQAVFEDSEIQTRYRPGARPMGWITAASTQIRHRHGMVFINSRLTRESSAVAAGSTMLGRPWHPTTLFADGRYADPDAVASVVFLNCWMDEHISPTGWDEMGGTTRDGGRIMFSPQEARFYEFRSHGPGAHVSSSRQQLTEQQARQFARQQVLDDWQPQP